MATFKGKGILWDPINNRALVDFTESLNGLYSTGDEKIIEVLRKAGYEEVPLTNFNQIEEPISQSVSNEVVESEPEKPQEITPKKRGRKSKVE
jgi:hypothetical protein